MIEVEIIEEKQTPVPAPAKAGQPPDAIVLDAPAAAAPAAAPIAAPASGQQIDLTGGGGAVKDATQYNLSGVVWHTGSSAGAGHYVADVRHGTEWKRHNDAVVTAVPAETVYKKDALHRGYIFFYVHSSCE